MVNHTCPKCKKVFSRRSHYNYHVYKRKKPCINKSNSENVKSIIDGENEKMPKMNRIEPNTTNLNQNEPKNSFFRQDFSRYDCSYCDKTFKFKSSLVRHLKSRCKTKNEYIKNFNKTSQLEDAIKLLSEQNELLKKQINTNITNNVNSNNNIKNITNHNNINIIGFGKEDLSFLSDKQIMYILDRGFNSVPELVERVHFNKEHPEFHNVYLTNISKDQSLVYKDDYWNRENAKDVVNRIIDEKKEFLDLKYQEYLEKNKIDPRIAKKFERFQEKSVSDDYEMDSLYHKVKMILYNKRHIPIETKRRNKRNKSY